MLVAASLIIVSAFHGTHMTSWTTQASHFQISNTPTRTPTLTPTRHPTPGRVDPCANINTSSEAWSFKVGTSVMDYASATTFCLNHDLGLAKINSSKLQQAAACACSQSQSGSNCWIGAVYSHNVRSWIWTTDNSRVVYSNWQQARNWTGQSRVVSFLQQNETYAWQQTDNSTHFFLPLCGPLISQSFRVDEKQNRFSTPTQEAAVCILLIGVVGMLCVCVSSTVWAEDGDKDGAFGCVFGGCCIVVTVGAIMFLVMFWPLSKHGTLLYSNVVGTSTTSAFAFLVVSVAVILVGLCMWMSSSVYSSDRPHIRFVVSSLFVLALLISFWFSLLAWHHKPKKHEKNKKKK